jgi:hypothetical protein
MRNLLRKPLPWMVLVECAIVAALLLVAWHLIADPPVFDSNVPAEVLAPAESGEAGVPVVPGPSGQSKPQAPLLLPGLNFEASFWRVRLAELNRGQAAFEALEWKLVHSAIGAARRYVESVVLPAVTRAERVSLKA